MTMAPQYPASGLYSGYVVHRRLAPARHILKYRIFSLFVVLEKIEELSQKSWLLSINKFNIVSFYHKDYGDGSRQLDQYVINEVKAHIPEIDINKIYLLTMPRILGYVFNPLSIYFCYDAQASLRAILYEVSNTFGQRHNYIFDVNEINGQIHTHECSKAFYVSPFLEMDLRYNFTISDPTQTFALTIQALKQSDVIMNAVQCMTFSELSNRNLARVLFLIPFMTIKVIAGIHFEALQLWLKGVSLVPKLSPVDKATRVIRHEGR